MTIPPVWCSTDNKSSLLLPEVRDSRAGIGEAEAIVNGVIVRWDVAADKNDVTYTLYYRKEPFDFEEDSDLTQAQKIELIPEIVNVMGEQIVLPIHIRLLPKD